MIASIELQHSNPVVYLMTDLVLFPLVQPVPFNTDIDFIHSAFCSLCSHLDSQDSDFFINLHRANSLDKSYTAFGLVISGLETIQFLCKDIPIHPTLEIPMSPVVIYDCGWRNLSSKFHLQASPINH